MKIKKCILITVLLLGVKLFAQQGLGASNPDRSAVLELKSGNKGLLIPRIALKSLGEKDPVLNPANSLLVFNITDANDVTPGLYYWDANVSKWTRVTSDKGDVSNDGWYSDAQNNVIATAKNSRDAVQTNENQMAIGDNGNVIIGNNVPLNSSAILDLNSTNKGMVIPRLDKGQRDLISNPVPGMMIFNTTAACLEVYASSLKGWYNVCTQTYSTERKAYFDFTCANLSTFPVGAKIPVGSDLRIENGYAIKLAYTNGNGGTFDTQTYNSSDPFGLTAVLPAGNVNGTDVAPGTGELTFNVLGKVTSLGSSSNAVFTINLLGRTCPIQFPLSNGSIGAVASVVASTDTKYAGFTVDPSSKVTLTYTGGDGGIYPAQSLSSTGVVGLQLSLAAGNFATGPGTLVYQLSGTPSSVGNAVFTGNIGGKSFTVTIAVTAFRNCKEILANNTSTPSGVYKIDPDLAGTASALVDCKCDMTTDGGGWTLVLNYVHNAANSSASTNPLNDKLPLQNATTLGTDEAGTVYYGHTAPSYLNLFNFTEFRFYGITSQHSKVMSFKTSFPSMISYFKTGTGQILMGPSGFGKAGTFTPIGTHTTLLPGSADSTFAAQGSNAMCNLPFYVYNAGINWNLGPGRYELDNYTGYIGQVNTLHQIWIR